VTPRQVKTIVVIPAFDEQGKIGRVIAKIPPGLADQVLVVDDCSNDDTAREAEQAGAFLIRHQENRGVGASIRTGIDHALANDYDIVAILSGDDQHDPNDLKEMLKLVSDEGFDFVQGSRRFAGLDAPNIGWFRRASTWFYAQVFRAASGFPCTDATNGGRVFRTRILRDRKIDLWQEWLNTYELEPYLLYKAIKNGLRVREAPMKVIYHGRGTSKMRPVRDWWRIFKPMIFLVLGLKK